MIYTVCVIFLSLHLCVYIVFSTLFLGVFTLGNVFTRTLPLEVFLPENAYQLWVELAIPVASILIVDVVSGTYRGEG